jgi:hypothetical protein
MAESTIDSAKDLIKAFGPSEEHRNAFNRTFLGTLLGQSVVLLGLVSAYLTAGLLFYQYAREDVVKLRSDLGPSWSWFALLAPAIAILFFSVLPLTWRAVRERRLKARTLGGSQFRPGYFRLYPYGAADRDTYTRLDGAAEEVTNRLRNRTESLLYLSGPSGSGKSSLLGAHALPVLRDEGWHIVETRVFDDGIAQLRSAVVDDEELVSRKPPSTQSLLSVVR